VTFIPEFQKVNLSAFGRHQTSCARLVAEMHTGECIVIFLI